MKREEEKLVRDVPLRPRTSTREFSFFICTTCWRRRGVSRRQVVEAEVGTPSAAFIAARQAAAGVVGALEAANIVTKFECCSCCCWYTINRRIEFIYCLSLICSNRSLVRALHSEQRGGELIVTAKVGVSQGNNDALVANADDKRTIAGV